ncbi:MAG: hypothetical protein WCB92_25325 [Mycobacterium sp.]
MSGTAADNVAIFQVRGSVPNLLQQQPRRVRNPVHERTDETGLVNDPEVAKMMGATSRTSPYGPWFMDAAISTVAQANLAERTGPAAR